MVAVRRSEGPEEEGCRIVAGDRQSDLAGGEPVAQLEEVAVVDGLSREGLDMPVDLPAVAVIACERGQDAPDGKGRMAAHQADEAGSAHGLFRASDGVCVEWSLSQEGRRPGPRPGVCKRPLEGVELLPEASAALLLAKQRHRSVVSPGAAIVPKLAVKDRRSFADRLIETQWFAAARQCRGWRGLTFQPANERSSIETLATRAWIRNAKVILLQGPMHTTRGGQGGFLDDAGQGIVRCTSAIRALEGILSGSA